MLHTAVVASHLPPGLVPGASPYPVIGLLPPGASTGSPGHPLGGMGVPQNSPPVSGSSFMIDDILGKSRTGVHLNTSLPSTPHTHNPPHTHSATHTNSVSPTLTETSQNIHKSPISTTSSPNRTPSPPSPRLLYNPRQTIGATVSLAPSIYKPTAMYDPTTATVLTGPPFFNPMGPHLAGAYPTPMHPSVASLYPINPYHRPEFAFLERHGFRGKFWQQNKMIMIKSINSIVLNSFILISKFLFGVF